MALEIQIFLFSIHILFKTLYGSQLLFIICFTNFPSIIFSPLLSTQNNLRSSIFQDRVFTFMSEITSIEAIKYGSINILHQAISKFQSLSLKFTITGIFKSENFNLEKSLFPIIFAKNSLNLHKFFTQFSQTPPSKSLG
jgi:hypothetical protein